MLKTVLRIVLAVAFVGAGINHFINAAFYVAIMPSYLPAHEPLVWLSGIAEVIIGAMLFVPRLRPVSGYAAIALLVAVFPANVHMALHPELFPDLPPAGLWARLPIQALLIGWAYVCTKVAKSGKSGNANKTADVASSFGPRGGSGGSGG